MLAHQYNSNNEPNEDGAAASCQQGLIVLEGKHAWRLIHLFGGNQPGNEAAAAAADSAHGGPKAGTAVPKEGKEDWKNSASG